MMQIRYSHSILAGLIKCMNISNFEVYMRLQLNMCTLILSLFQKVTKCYKRTIHVTDINYKLLTLEFVIISFWKISTNVITLITCVYLLLDKVCLLHKILNVQLFSYVYFHFQILLINDLLTFMYLHL